MPTRADVERLRSANAEISRMVRREVAGFWSTLDTSQYGAARQALVEFIPALTQRYGDLAASVATEWYDEMRGKSLGRSLQYRALPANVAPTVQVEHSTRWAVRDLASPTAQGALLGTVDRLTLQASRDTISGNAKREGVKWARIPTGAETCSFCLMLASRGFDYGSSASAGDDRNKYHADCDCVPTPSWTPGDERVEGYDPAALYDIYESARGSASDGSTKQILANLREQTGRR